jgi:acetyl esterase/lipase
MEPMQPPAAAPTAAATSGTRVRAATVGTDPRIAYTTYRPRADQELPAAPLVLLVHGSAHDQHICEVGPFEWTVHD